ncbi:putative lipase ROG1 [Phalaenopsis equestris]|uniref:putative lipase ROG1 n=1 Tax=Phalaenopsis equestris TaxID=78828 RepID=UPI0009E21C3C|nr:putative lipase ROG1 [Phalaenopsis equestris]XP_020600198.1 putative lipase ROG1 [Phalaenopsis equestris]XP_020600199.1 putative lipase ROG1 [Phalaenopsis equestris]XP_020600200.1 putative lipase ROG1 [Phalaenopsis equestris]
MSYEVDGDVSSEDKPNGGLDMWISCPELPTSPPDHLVVMVHGILGSTTDWLFGANQFVKSFPGKIIVHCSERNMHKLTLDGVDVMGERLAEEVADVINSKPELKKISFVAHSVGGLVARYAIGKLYRPPIEKFLENSDCNDNNDPRGTICGLQAINFVTVATPHLGSRGNGQVPFLFGFTAIETLASRVVHWIFGRTGRHLFLTDNDDGELPLLLRMVNDCSGFYFVSSLKAFIRRVAYANAGCDHIVGWRTSSIRRNCELPKWELALSQKYPHIVYEENSVGDNCDQHTQISPSDCDYEEEMVTCLSRVPWEKVDVSFHNSKQWIAAHSVIQVKYSFMQSEGADVIQHMIDHFLL